MPIINQDVTTMTGSEFKDAINKAMVAQEQWSFNLDFMWPTDDNQWRVSGGLFGFLLTFKELSNGEDINNFLSAPQVKKGSYDLLLSLASLTGTKTIEGTTTTQYFPPDLSAIQQFNNIAHVIIQPEGLEFYCYSKEKFLNTPLQLRGTFMPSYVPDKHYYMDSSTYTKAYPDSLDEFPNLVTILDAPKSNS